MRPKNTAKVFLTLMSLFFVCTSSALAGDQVQHQTNIIDRINNQPHQTGIIDELKDSWNTLRFCGEALLSEASYKINHLTSTDADSDNVTIQADLVFWNDLQAEYPFSEKPVFISKKSVFEPAYNYVPEGVSEATVFDNSGNALDSYTVTKNETGVIIQKGVSSNPDRNYTITIDKIKELDGIYGNIGEVQAGKMYIKEQIQAQT
ncbi:MAG: hypothetical protein EHM20_05925 [Alphaproteobacteria bacterium]|nr:MAG: hypothetical protein EHM20_05925 [Alphaproteobacteria bacterium]